MESDNAKLEHQIKIASKKLKELNQRIKEAKLEITDSNRKMAQCAKQKIADEKATKRAAQEMEKVEQKTEVSKEETRKVEVLHNNLLETLVTKKEEVATVEETLKTTADALKKQVKDEAHARTVLQARITSDTQDLSKTQVDSKKKREKATQRADEIEKLVDNVQEQMMRLLEKRVNNEDSLKDHRELYVLQGRMREALEYFYRLRGLQSKADIAEFELKCVESGDKLVNLRSEMMRVVEHINCFLEANNASHDVISVEAAKIAQTPPAGALVA